MRVKAYNPNGQKTMADSAPVVIASDQTPIDVNITGGSVTIGADVEITNDAGNPIPVNDAGGSLTVDDGGLSLTVDGSVTANAGTNLNTSLLALESGGNLADIKTAVQIIDDWDESDRAKVNPIVGQAGVQAGAGAVSASTQRVVIATDQTAIPVTGTFGATDNTSLYNNSLAVTGTIAGIDTTGYSSIIIQISGVWAGNMIFEGSADNSIWQPINILNVNEISIQDVITENGLYQVKATSKYIRLNVIQIQSGTIAVVILGRTVSGISAVDNLSLAMDKSNNTPLYVEETGIKKDSQKALVFSDAPTPVYGFTNAGSAVPFLLDTTGYQSIVVQVFTFGSGWTMQTSNDGATWIALLGGPTTVTTGATSSITFATIWEYPVLGRYVRALSSGASFTNALVYLRLRPYNPFGFITGAPMNIQSIGGTAATIPSGNNSAGTQVTTGLAAGIPVGGTATIGSTTVAWPVIVGGREAPSDGALSGKVRTLLTDTLGKAIVTGDISANQSTQNTKSVPTQDQSTFEGQSMIEIMAQILLELRIQNQYMSELPMVLQGKDRKFDEPITFRNDPTIFA